MIDLMKQPVMLLAQDQDENQAELVQSLCFFFPFSLCMCT